MLEETGCDANGGRGSQGNCDFSSIIYYLETGFSTRTFFQEKLDTIIRHMEMLVALKGEHIGVCEMRI